MPNVRELLPRYRLLILAVLLSASLHAALIVGTPGRAGTLDEAAAAIYTASLDSEGMRVEDPAGPPAPKPAARRPRPKKVAPPPRPEEIVASVPDTAEEPAGAPSLGNCLYPRAEPGQTPQN